MADQVFSTARLRGYRVLESAGLADAVELQILNTVIAGRLWLPFSLIEIAFRNAADRAIAERHPSGEDWLLASGRNGDVLIARDTAAPVTFRGRRDDGTLDDPIAEAARMAARQLGRNEISRDDLIAHLMMGFWVHRCHEALRAELDTWPVIAGACTAPLDNPLLLEETLTRLLRMRNRVAHHEALLFRAKHVFARSGEAKAGAGLVTSLLDAIPAFLNDVQVAVETAATLAPMASTALTAVQDSVRADIAPLEAKLIAERRRLREAREARLAARGAELVRRRAEEES